MRIVIEHDGWEEIRLTFAGYEIAANALAGAIPAEAEILFADFFGTNQEIVAMEQARDWGDIQRTRLFSTAALGGSLQVCYAQGGMATPILHSGRRVGTLVEGKTARQAYLSGLVPSDCRVSQGEQTESIFAAMSEVLASTGMSFADVARTWFYNEDILGWYDVFNAVRTGYFRQHGVRRMPASTGIGASNPAGAALVAKLHAVTAKDNVSANIAVVNSPLQCSAFDYGSAFSRAMLVEDGVARCLTISGTASIEPGGASAHLGDVAAQIELTMRVVEAILGEARMTLADTNRAVAYLRSGADLPIWHDWLAQRGIKNFPCAELASTVCRNDLLFEIELDAANSIMR